ncbi:hypothetical protein FSST1_012786 [Fusarium sambucinum]
MTSTPNDHEATATPATPPPPSEHIDRSATIFVRLSPDQQEAALAAKERMGQFLPTPDMVGITAAQNPPSPEVRDSPTQSSKSPSPDSTGKQPGTVQDVVRPTERLLNCVESNTSIILQNLQSAYDDCIQLLEILSNIVDHYAQIHATHCALANTAEADIAQIQSLINASNEALNEANESSDQALGTARFIVRQQVEILQSTLQASQNAAQNVETSYRELKTAERNMEAMITQIKWFKDNIKKWSDVGN